MTLTAFLEMNFILCKCLLCLCLPSLTNTLFEPFFAKTNREEGTEIIFIHGPYLIEVFCSTRVIDAPFHFHSLSSGLCDSQWPLNLHLWLPNRIPNWIWKWGTECLDRTSPLPCPGVSLVSVSH